MVSGFSAVPSPLCRGLRLHWVCIRGIAVGGVRPGPFVQEAGEQGPADTEEDSRPHQPVLPPVHRQDAGADGVGLKWLGAVPVEVSVAG